MTKKIITRTITFLLITISINGNAMGKNFEDCCVNNFIVKNFSMTHEPNKSIDFLMNFFQWYKTKYDYLDHHIFPVSTDYKNSTPYRINFNETEKYLSILKSSGFFSENYINHYRNYFRKIDATLQKTKQNDGTVEGLEYDLILHSQEPEAILGKLVGINLQVVKNSPNDVIVKMKTSSSKNTYCLYYLTKNGNKYLIDEIDFFINNKVQN